MPDYDQTNPNFAAYLTPKVFSGEGTSAIADSFGSGSSTVLNPFCESWLPYGPIPGDANALSWGAWYTAICGPTAESMALTAAIANKSTSTTYSGWVKTFYDYASPTTPNSGLTNQEGPIFPFVTDPRQNMKRPDIQKVIDMAIAQGTNPAGGGGEDYIVSLASDFSPTGVGANGNTNDVSNATFEKDIEDGTVVVIAIHYYTAHVTLTGTANGVTNYAVTFTNNPGGHCLAINGCNPGSSTSSMPGALLIYNPVYGAKQWISIVNIVNGSSTHLLVPIKVGGPIVPLKVGGPILRPLPEVTRTVTLPNSWTSIGIWPDTTTPIDSVWDITDGEAVTFIDEYHTLNVP